MEMSDGIIIFRTVFQIRGGGEEALQNIGECLKAPIYAVYKRTKSRRIRKAKVKDQTKMLWEQIVKV
jgi:hypothetical protein